MNILKITKVLPKTSNSLRFELHDYDDGRDRRKEFEAKLGRIRLKAVIGICSYSAKLHRDIPITPAISQIVDVMFRRYLDDVLSNKKTPWEIALDYQSQYWPEFKGWCIDLIRSKLTIMGYDPKVWLEAGK